MQAETLPSSRAVGLHCAPVATAVLSCLFDDAPAGLSAPPQKLHDLQAHEEQCMPRCSTLHHERQASKLRSSLLTGVHALPDGGGASEGVGRLFEGTTAAAAAAAREAKAAALQKSHCLQSHLPQCDVACFS